jgi:hypothetical protein
VPAMSGSGATSSRSEHHKPSVELRDEVDSTYLDKLHDFLVAVAIGVN